APQCSSAVIEPWSSQPCWPASWALAPAACVARSTCRRHPARPRSRCPSDRFPTRATPGAEHVPPPHSFERVTPMPWYAHRDGELFAEDVRLADIAERHGTPTFVYSARAIREAYREFAEACAGRPVTICYALKANSN